MNRIVHIGVGNFFRAHLADYTQRAGGWRITGVSLRSAAVRDGLAAQGFAYRLCVQGEGVRKIDVLDGVLVAPEDPEAVLAAMVDADVISVTVTEKGYHLAADGALDLYDPVIAAELAGQGTRSVIGFLAHALVRRRIPVTVLSCDNRLSNGDVLRRAVRRFADAAALSVDWSLVSFPNAMVDRITPATTDALRLESGDAMAVPTEAFSEWVIEDRFAGPRPDWPDVQFVDDVAPHEMRKLRMLNGAHSYLAYAGVLAGHEYVHEAIADPALRAVARGLMAEAAQTLPLAVRGQAGTYAEALIARFGNPHLKHRLRQIAMDGSEKIPYRFADSLRALDAQGLDAPCLTAAVASWVAFCEAECRAGRTLDDPRGVQIADAVASGNSAMLHEMVGVG